MAALPAGVQYGLSSESSYKENKELVFVKLTDSALKAIEDFIRNNRDKLAKPKIQFLPGNEGGLPRDPNAIYATHKQAVGEISSRGMPIAHNGSPKYLGDLLDRFQKKNVRA
ncbi:unnamed protein product, partial [Iphiclides podalirius]